MKIEKKLNKALKTKDENLIHSIFEEIYKEYGKLVYFKIMEYIKEEESAKDLMQDVFVSFFNNINFIKLESIKYYLLTSAKNKSINYLKNKNNNTVIYEDYIYNLEEAKNIDSLEYKNVLYKMREILSDFEIKIVLRHTLDDLSFKKLSKEYGKSINTILSTYFRAIKKIKEALDNEK